MQPFEIMGADREKRRAQDLSWREERIRHRELVISYYRKRRIEEIEEEREIDRESKRRWMVAHPPSVPPPLHLLSLPLFIGAMDLRPKAERSLRTNRRR
jgi:Zn ribbon nucleic-acid-binding protein